MWCWRRKNEISGTIVSEMGLLKEDKNVQQKKKANWVGRICVELPSKTSH